MPPELKAVIDEINRAWNELQAEMKAAAPSNEKIEAINAKIAELETKMSRPGAGLFGGADTQEPSPEEKAATKAVCKWLRGQQLSPDEAKLVYVPGEGPSERKIMRADNDTTSVFASSEMEAAIIREELEFDPVRTLVRVRTTGKRSVKAIKKNGSIAAQWVGEIETRENTEGLKFTLEEIPNHELTALIPVSLQDLEDADFDLEELIRQECAEQFALAEGPMVVSGDGIKKGEGFLVHPDVEEDKTGDASKLTYDGLVDLSHKGNSNYALRGRFVLNLKTLGEVRKIKDENKMPIWAPMTSDAPATILGRPYTILPSMPNVEAGKYPVAYGDFQAAYTLVDRRAIEFLRDPFTLKKQGAIEISARKRIGGQVVQPKAIRKLKVAA